MDGEQKEMNGWGFKSALTSCAIVTMLAGCGGTQTGGPMLMNNTAADRAKAQKLTASSGDLLYVSDGPQDLRVFSLPQGDLVHIITDVALPAGQCADTDGNVYVVDGDKLLEFAHGGTEPIKILYYGTSSQYSEANWCAVDPTTGNIALTGYNERATTVIDVFSKGTGTPTPYTIPGWFAYYSVTYDDDGNLYVGGSNSSNEFLLAKMQKGSDTFTNISLAFPTIYANLQFEDGYLTISALSNKAQVTINQVQIRGSSAKIVNSVYLKASREGEPWIEGGQVAAQYCNKPPYFNHCRAVALWKYPAGGTATTIIRSQKFLKKHGIRGLSISVGPSRK